MRSNWVRENLSIEMRTHVIVCQPVKHSPKISNLFKRDVSNLYVSDINGKIASEHWRGHFSSALCPLTRWVQKGVLKHEFSGIQETTFFDVNNLRNIDAMKLILFFQSVENLM